MVSQWYSRAMEVTMDRAGRIVVPKGMRERFGMVDGGTFDLSVYGGGLQLIPHGRTAQLVERDGALVLESQTVITDDDVFALIDSIRK